MSSQVTMASPINQFWTGWLTRPMRSERKGTTGQRWRAGFDDAGENNKSAKTIFRKADGRQAIPIRAGIKTLGVILFLSLAGLSSPQRAQAQTTINICDRTPQIEARILSMLGKTEADCGSVTAAELVTLGYYNRSWIVINNDRTLTTLKAGDFDGLTSLRSLSLSGNSLSSLPPGIFDELTNLRSLYLDDNRLRSLPPGIFDKTKLQTLDLSKNSLSSLPAGIFDKLTNLSLGLSLYDNPLSTLPAGVFDKLIRLRALDLRRTVSSLPAGILDKLTNLDRLGYAGPLSSGVFDKFTRLEYLWMDNSSLSSLPAGVFDKLTRLSWLKLDNNNLSSLPAGVFNKLTRLKKLSLDNNSLTCLPSIPSSVTELSVDQGLPTCIGVTVTESNGSTEVSEAGGTTNTDTYTVALDTEPTASVTITVTSGDTGAATVSPATLTFSTTNWNSGQTVTVSGVDDFVTQSSDRSVTIGHSATSSDAVYNGIAIVDVRATVVDDDTAGVSIIESSGSTVVSEAAGAGRTDTYTVELATLPTGSVTVAVTSGAVGAATVSPATLTFSTSDWNSEQTVTVNGVDDFVDQSSDRSVTISHSATSSDTAYSGIAIADVTVTVVDDDTTAGVSIIESSGSTAVSEAAGAGRTDTYTVELATLPTGSVTVAVTSGAVGAATVSPATLTFSTSDWNSEQTVTVTGVDDFVDQSSDRSVTISHSATSSDTAYSGITIADVTVTVVDDDTTAGVSIIESSGSTAVSEAAGTTNTDAYTVALASEPTASVTITVTSGDTGAATLSPATLTFSTTNWNTAQTVTVTGVDDFVTQSSDRSVTISHSSTSSDANYNGIAIADVRATVVDDDTAGVSIIESSGSTAVSEAAGAGRTDAYTVALASEPTASVTITVTSGDRGAATVSPATLTFSTSNWNSGQTVTVTGVDDFVTQSSDRRVSISHSATSSDTAYSGIAIADVTVTVVDDDTAGVSIIESSGSTVVSEAGGTTNTDAYTVALASEPTASVTITVTSGDRGAATVGPATLTFTPTNWGTAQTVTVSGVDDDVDRSREWRAANHSVTISHSATSRNGAYNGIAIDDVSVTVLDDDRAGVSIIESEGGTTVTEGEGGSDNYTVVLASEPTANVRIMAASDTPGVGLVNGRDDAYLTFTPSNWNSAQTVTASVVDDNIDQSGNRREVIIHSASSADPNYGVIAAPYVTVTVLDDDRAGVSIIESDGFTSVSEAAGAGQSDTYTVALTSEPIGGVTVRISSNQPDAVVVRGPGRLSDRLAFSRSNWSTPQTVTVTGVGDSVDQEVDRSVAISHIASSHHDPAYHGFSSRLSVVVVDNDTAGVRVRESEGFTSVREAAGPGQWDRYTVVLTSEPAAKVTLRISSDKPGAVTLSRATLTFHRLNWNVAQTVIVTGVEDHVDQPLNRRVTISHAASSADPVYDGISIPWVSATVVDDDTADVRVVESEGFTSVREAAGVGQSDTYTVVLTSEPTHEVRVRVVSGTPGAALVNGAGGSGATTSLLTFTPTNWETAQTVTVTGVDDHVVRSGNRSARISHSASSEDPIYDGISIPWVSATVVEDREDAGVRIIQPEGAILVTEWPEARPGDRYTVALTSEPTHEVRITVISATPGAALVDIPGDVETEGATITLTFTPTNWETGQTVTVIGVNDHVDQGTSRRVSISHGATSLDPFYDGISIPSVSATVLDDDTAGVTITESGGTTVVTEAAGARRTDHYTVAITSEPTHEVRVTVVSDTPGAAMVNGAGTTAGSTTTLTFTPSTWSTPQTVTVTGVDDRVGQGANRGVSISHGATSLDTLYDGFSIPAVSATVMDDDDGAGVRIIQSGGATVVTEAAGVSQADSYTVVLTTEPTHGVRVTVVSGTAGAALVNGAGTTAGSTTTLTFSPSTWSTPQTVTVTGVDDGVDQGAVRTSRISHSANSEDTAYEGISIPWVRTTVVDDDTAGVRTLQSGGATLMTEGQTDTYTVVLTSEPTHEVTVAINSKSSPGVAVVNGAGTTAGSTTTLTFTPSTWSTPQTVTVTGVDDNVDQFLNKITRLEHHATSADPTYDGISIPWLTAVVVDDENAVPATRVVDVTTGSGTTIGEGDSATFTFTANPAPGAGSTMTVSFTMTGAPFRKRTSGVGYNEGSASATMGGAHSIIIDDSGMAQFTVSTLDNSLSEGKVKITATVDPGVGYSPHPRHGAASITVVDDDPGLMLSADSLSVEAGGSASYTMALATEPMGEVTVSISGGEGSGVTVAPTHLTFSQGNWDRPQSVGIRAAETSPALAAPVTLSHTASGGNYGGLTADVVVNVAADAVAKEAKTAWHLRLGRTISHQMVDALQDRLAARPATGLQVTVAGEAITDAPPLVENQGILSKALGFETVSPEALLEGSSFSFVPAGEERRPQVALWGQGALSSFRGEQEDISLDGDVTTLLLGADWTGRRWQAGAALSQSWGHGSYDGDNDADGEISSTVTGLFPYGRYALTPRLGLWAVAGYGWGQLFLKPDGEDGMEEEYKPSTIMAMGAIGMDGLLRDGGSKGITLKSTADVLTVKTTSAEVDGLDSSEGSLSRLRLGVEAVRPFPLTNGSSLLPSMELGIRQDGGDAETGFGMDLGAGILWQAPGHGISGELKGHTLLTHAEEEFQDQGLALSFSWEPNPSNRGPSLSIGHTMGAAPSEGMDALLHPTTMEGLDATPNSGQRFEAEVAYGFPAHNDRLTITPAVEMAFSSTSRNYNLLWSVAPHAHQTQGQPWELSLEGGRHEQLSSTAPPDHSLKLTFSTLF